MGFHSIHTDKRNKTETTQRDIVDWLLNYKDNSELDVLSFSLSRVGVAGLKARGWGASLESPQNHCKSAQNQLCFTF